MIKLLVTGTRRTPHKTQVTNVLSLLWDDLEDDDVMLIHGDCPHPSGRDAFDIPQVRVLFSVDKIADEFAESAGWRIWKFPAHWNICDKNCYHKPRSDGKCPAAGPRRNKAMVDALDPATDMVIAFPQGESKGTRGTIELARAHGIEPLIYELGD